MANYTAVGAKHATLTASTVDVVTLDRAYPMVEIINRDASADLWVSVDRGYANQTTLTPSVAGDGCLYVAAGAVRVVPDDPAFVAGSAGAGSAVSTVRLISASAVAYSVTGLTA